MDKLGILRQSIRGLDAVLVAYSGGVDSALLAKVACDELGERALAVTAQSESLDPSELELARQTALEIGISHRVIVTRELDNPSYRGNPHDRCYFCKTELFSTLGALAKETGIPYIIEGTTRDDLNGHRPGRKAAQEHHVRSPYVELEIGKQEVREMASQMGLRVSEKPSTPCLASRVAYGIHITPEVLKRISEAENFLRSLGFTDVRVRHYDVMARIEIVREEIPRLADDSIRRRIVDEFKRIGYIYVTLDLQGRRSGSMNEILEWNIPESGRAQRDPLRAVPR